MKKLLLGFCFATILIACKKTPGPEGPQGPQGPAGQGSTSGTGIITGKVDHYDQYSVQYTTGLNTTTVSVDETDISAQTDAAGNYTLTNVPEGILDISYIKDGAGLSKNTQLVFPGKGTMYLNKSVHDKATYLLSGGVVKDSSIGQSPIILTRLQYNSEPKSRKVLLVLGKTPEIDITNQMSYESTHIINLPPGTDKASSTLVYSTSFINLLPSGSTFYAKVYPTGHSEPGYYDYKKGKQVFTSCGTPLATTFTLTKP